MLAYLAHVVLVKFNYRKINIAVKLVKKCKKGIVRGVNKRRDINNQSGNPKNTQ